ncbi:hypothetical protein ACFE04_027306 [Oxalis oulophora]
MDFARSSANGEDSNGIPGGGDLRCKRSDGKQWRCTALSMPDKTVCEKHYIQAKKRAANSALRASMKKVKRGPYDDGECYLESKSDDLDMALEGMQGDDFNTPESSGMKHRKLVGSSEIQFSPIVRGLSMHDSFKPDDDDLDEDLDQSEENWGSQKSPNLMDSNRNMSEKGLDIAAMEYADGATSDESEETGGQTCHQCRRNGRVRVVWCLKCDRRGYCDTCISACYSDMPVEEIEKACPACRGSCNCKMCLRADNLVKAKIRKMPVLDKLQYLYCLLSSVLPVVKQINHEQCSEVELEKRLHGTEIDLARSKLNADEQMCCNICRIPIIDYHRHCPSCSYDLCLSCCKDLREAANGNMVHNQTNDTNQDKNTPSLQPNVSRPKLNLPEKFTGWKANNDGSIPCPPKEHGGCGYSSMNLSRIFKMNWVAKLAKNVEEMVGGCKVNDLGILQNSELNDPRVCRFSDREDTADNFLYCPSSEDIRTKGLSQFRKHWSRGEPIIVKGVCDSLSLSSWDPMVIWRGIRETGDEKMKDKNRTVKAIEFFDGSEVDIELGQFIEGYLEGRVDGENGGRPQMLKLKDWPSPSASEEFLFYNRPEFISKLPLLEYIHSRLGFLNVAAKLPHYSLQNDVGPKIFMSYGTTEVIGRGHSVTALHFDMHDMAYLLVHTHNVKSKSQRKMEIGDIQKCGVDEASGDPEISLKEGSLGQQKMEINKIHKYEESSGDPGISLKEGSLGQQKMEIDQIQKYHVDGSSGDPEISLKEGSLGQQKMEIDEVQKYDVDEASGDPEKSLKEGSLGQQKMAIDKIQKYDVDESSGDPRVSLNEEILGQQKMEIDKIQKYDVDESSGDPGISLNEGSLPDLSLGGHDGKNESEIKSVEDEDRKKEDQIETFSSLEDRSCSGELSNQDDGKFSEKIDPAARWDIFRRQDVPKLEEYLRLNWNNIGKSTSFDDFVIEHPLYDVGGFLNEHHIRQLKEQFRVEPWTIDQHLGEAVFVPAGCPFQVRNLQSTVQLGLDFLFPESVTEASRLAEEMRCLSNDHEAKLRILEVGKISLYAASSAIKEVQKLVLDPKLGKELGFEDRNLTASVSENLELAKARQRQRHTCA